MLQQTARECVCVCVGRVSSSSIAAPLTAISLSSHSPSLSSDCSISRSLALSLLVSQTHTVGRKPTCVWVWWGDEGYPQTLQQAPKSNRFWRTGKRPRPKSIVKFMLARRHCSVWSTAASTTVFKDVMLRNSMSYVLIYLHQTSSPCVPAWAKIYSLRVLSQWWWKQWSVCEHVTEGFHCKKEQWPRGSNCMYTLCHSK